MIVEYKTNDLADLDSVMQLSQNIFDPFLKEIKKSNDKEDWMKKLNNGGLLITAYVENNLAGFVLCYIREINYFHIWQAGVLEDYRGLGIWRDLHGKAEEYAKSKNFSKLTLNTYRDRFPVMYQFAIRHGFICYKKETKDKGEKSFFEKKI